MITDVYYTNVHNFNVSTNDNANVSGYTNDNQCLTYTNA